LDSSDNTVEELKNQLLSLGYHPFQLNQIIKDAIGTANTKNINSTQVEVLITTLEDYISFASKSNNLKL
jgi:hypothetical protein